MEIAVPCPVDKSKYVIQGGSNDLERFYGLPGLVEFCSNCVFSNQKPNSEQEYKHTLETQKPTLSFNDEGICSACLVAKNKQDIDWAEREAKLKTLCDRYRSRNSSYDCLVPGSGGKDSFYAAYKLKYEYGMNPLTVTWAPHIYTDWGWENFKSWIHAGFDNYLFTPNGRVHRLLTRLAVEKLFHPFQPFIMGQMYYPPKMAAKFDIPLVFYGENPTEYGNEKKEDQTSSKDQRYFSTSPDEDVFISGMSIESLRSHFGLSKLDLDPYLPITDKDLHLKSIDVQYLGYYLPWHPQDCYYFAAENGGFKAAPERTAGTYSKYSSIDDKIDDLHYYTTFIKFGIGRATYDASQEVRNSDITRDEAVALVARYDGEYSDRFEKEVFDYLSITEKEFGAVSGLFEQPIMDKELFDLITDQFRSPHIWQLVDGSWKLRETAY